MTDYKTIAESNNFIVLDRYTSEWKVSETWSKPESGGYIRHTTCSGKTLTSFKAARLATEFEYIDKVFFVVDRTDLDYKTMKDYQKFSPDCVNGSENTAGLKCNMETDYNKIIENKHALLHPLRIKEIFQYILCLALSDIV